MTGVRYQRQAARQYAAHNLGEHVGGDEHQAYEQAAPAGESQLVMVIVPSVAVVVMSAVVIVVAVAVVAVAGVAVD